MSCYLYSKKKIWTREAIQHYVCPFIPVLFVIVWSVRLLFTASDYPFGIFKFFVLLCLRHEVDLLARYTYIYVVYIYYIINTYLIIDLLLYIHDLTPGVYLD